MGTRIRAVLSVGAIAVCVGLAASACSSGSTAGVESASSSASASPAFPVESLPPGVQKDSVQDLNSTKDMTGVVTTLPVGESPYIDYLPDVCKFVPKSVDERFGFSSRMLGFRGTRLIVQSCVLQSFDQLGLPATSLTVSFYANNIEEISRPDRVQIVSPSVEISSQVTGRVNKLIPSGPADETALQTCDTDWGTFFGAVSVAFRISATPPQDSCPDSIEAAKLIAPSMPKSPSQMRPAK